MADGNFITYFPDGSLTYSDKRKGTWFTINPKGVKRMRRLQDGTVCDEQVRLRVQTKVDPETNATLKIREDGVLSVDYIDQTQYIIMPDGTSMVRKKRADGEAGFVTFITKDGYVPIR
jgi:ArsR family metal-binding transcriptional regulator